MIGKIKAPPSGVVEVVGIADQYAAALKIPDWRFIQIIVESQPNKVWLIPFCV